MVTSLLSIVVITGESVLASEKKVVDWNAYYELSEKGAFNQAYEYIKKYSEYLDDPNIYFQMGILEGSGKLEGGVNRCGAILNLERAFSMGLKYVLPTMDSLYGGDWVSYASLEGNAHALYLSGMRILETKASSNPLSVYDKNVNKNNAIQYFRAAQKLGNWEAADTLKKLGALQQSDPRKQDIPEYRMVFCPVRIQ